MTKQVKLNFTKRVSELSRSWQPVLEASENLAAKQLEFARQVKLLWDEAKLLDEQYGGHVNANLVREKVIKLIGTTNRSIFSRWQRIGEFADVLMDHVESLPPHRDTLYQLSVAIEQKKPIQKWITQKKISPETSFREVVSLSKGAARRKSSAHEDRLLNVVLRFNGSSNDVALLLRGVVESELTVIVRSDLAIIHELKAVMKQEFNQIESKFNGK